MTIDLTEQHSSQTPLWVLWAKTRMPPDMYAAMLHDIEAKDERLDRMRSALVQCAEAAGGKASEDCSDGFLCEIPNEVRARINNLTNHPHPKD